MKNPFEEKRKNDRINRLVAENERLKQDLKQDRSRLQSLEMQETAWGQIANTFDLMKAEYKLLQDKYFALLLREQERMDNESVQDEGDLEW